MSHAAPVQNGNGTLSRTNSTPSSAACSPIQGVPGPGGVSPKPTRVTAKNRGDLKWPPEVVEIIPETIAFEIPVARMEEPIVRQSRSRKQPQKAKEEREKQHDAWRACKPCCLAWGLGLGLGGAHLTNPTGVRLQRSA